MDQQGPWVSTRNFCSVYIYIYSKLHLQACVSVCHQVHDIKRAETLKIDSAVERTIINNHCDENLK